MKRGKKACDISARTLFQLMDKGFEFSNIREVIEKENEEVLNTMIDSLSGSVTGKPGRPLSKTVQSFLESNGFTVEKLYSTFPSVKERRSFLRQARKAMKMNELK